MSVLTKYIILIGILSLMVYGLSGCTTGYNPCVDNPRNMSCMSAEELERELNAI